MNPRLAKALDEIKAWVEINAHEAIANLNPPATRQLLAKLKFIIPPDTPKELFELLELHNGEDGDGCPTLLPDAMLLLDIDSILLHYRYQMKKRDETPEEVAPYVACGHYRVKGPVYPIANNSRCVPFAARNFDIFWMLDLQPAPGGTFGQVIEEDLEDGRWEVVAPSLTELFERYAHDLRDGLFAVRDGFIECTSGLWPQNMADDDESESRAQRPKLRHLVERAVLQTADADAEYNFLAPILDHHWADQASPEFGSALADLELLALAGHERAAGFLAEILWLDGPRHDAARAYIWYYIALSREGYLVAFANEHPDPGHYCGPVGDFRNESTVRDLVDELGLERLPVLDEEARLLLQAIASATERSPRK